MSWAAVTPGLAVAVTGKETSARNKKCRPTLMVEPAFAQAVN